MRREVPPGLDDPRSHPRSIIAGREAIAAAAAVSVKPLMRLVGEPWPTIRSFIDAVGVSIEPGRGVPQPRDPQFRTRVLVAYEYRCAMCGLDLRIGNVTIALEAAHIQWHQAGGPDTELNGVALCSLHHKLFDLGAFTIHTDYRILLSELVHGTGQFEQVLLRHHGQQIAQPARPQHVPLPKYLAWHRREVFKERARFLEGVE
jgi:putative restriction endonuclease